MIKHVPLGKTGIHVSAIGLGSVKFGRNQHVHYPETFTLPTDKAIAELLQTAKGLGINLLDTAPAYGLSEERLGRALRNTRKDWIISSKAGEEFINGCSSFDFSALAIRNSVIRSLKRLQTDYLDLVLLHCNAADEVLIKTPEALATLNQLKQEGLLRAIGVSSKTVEGGLLALHVADVVMVMHNPVYTAEQPVIAYAHEQGKGVLIKKAFASGHLQKIAGPDPVLTAMRFIFAEPGVSSIIIGTLNCAHLQHNVHCAQQALAELA